MSNLTQETLEYMLTCPKEERIFLAQESFALFVVYYFNHYFSVPFAEYHYEMLEDAQKLVEKEELRELAWIMYRESAKTTIAKLFIIWLITFKKRSYLNVDSADKENSERILFDVAYELSNNQKLIEDFGILYPRKKGIDEVKQTRINNFVTENGIRVEAHSTQESIRGRLHLNQRPDFLLLDDFEINKTKDSLAYTKQIQEHITEAMGGMAGNGRILH